MFAQPPVHSPPGTPPPDPAVSIGVGIDTSRYGHYSAFLDHLLKEAGPELAFAESAMGYSQFRQRLATIAARYPSVVFSIRLDAAGQYAENLLHYLPKLDASSGDPSLAIANARICVSRGDPQRNKNYRATFFGSKKSDPVEARATARFAIKEQPKPTAELPAPLRALRQIASRLQAVVCQRTRLINQLHQLLALSFPELGLLIKDISKGWVLELLNRYPTAACLSKATDSDLEDIQYSKPDDIANLREHARSSVSSICGSTMEELVRDQIRHLRDTIARKERLEELLVTAYRQLPKNNHLDTIPGIGEVTAAVLTAVIYDIERFETAGKLVAYFGVLPVEASSGIDREGKPKSSRRFIMSNRGNDLVRRYLWMAALVAVRWNPAVQGLYRRVVAKHPQQKSIAIGHVMQKLVRLCYAVWKTDRPFDPTRHLMKAGGQPDESSKEGRRAEVPPSDKKEQPTTGENQTAGHKPDSKPAEKVVTAACAETVGQESLLGKEGYINFEHIKCQLSMAKVLDHLGVSNRMHGDAVQRRGPCPIHGGSGRGRTFSVNLVNNVFCCFGGKCDKKGDVIDLWAEVRKMTLREAAVDLVRTFNLEPAPANATEKRHG